MTNLFKKAAMFTDIHYGLRTNSEQHNKDCDAFVDWFIKTAKSEGCETCFFLGDWHHNRATINIQTLHYSLSGLDKLSANFKDVYFIIGNHDMFARHKRDVNSLEWAKHLPNVHLIDRIVTKDDVTICPFLVGDEYHLLKDVKTKYLMGHLELPSFLMNAQIEMPDHGELQASHVGQFDYVFSGHFHKRQQKGNVIYIGNAFPHNYSDVNDDARGMMILEWGGKPEFKTWTDAPKFRIYSLSAVLDRPEELLLSNSYVKINLDIDLSFEEAAFIRETLIPQYKLREMTLIPMKSDLETDSTDYSNTAFESVDTIIQKQIDELQEGAFDKKLLLSIYQNLN
jgi:DNA repair exonuclease SbcCD nuclease subunit